MDASARMADPTPFSETLLASVLVDRGWATEDEIAAAREDVTAWAPDVTLAPGPALVGATDGKQILAFDPLTGRQTGAVPLFPNDPGVPETAPPPWPMGCEPAIAVVDPELGTLLGYQDLAHAPRLGLVASSQGGFLYTGERPRQALSPRLDALPSPYMNPPGASGPLDLTLSRDGRILVAVNRGAGTVHAIVVPTLAQHGAFSLRPAGSSLRMGVAISPDAKTVYVSDGVTPRLAILETATFKLRHQLFPTGPLGALTIAPDGTSMTVAAAKGPHETTLLSVSLPDLRITQILNWPGKGVGDRAGIPADAPPDSGFSFWAPYAHETRDPQVLLAVDRKLHRVSKSQALKRAPLALASPAPAAWCPEPPDLGTALVARGVLSPERLLAARQAVETDPREPISLRLADAPINPAVMARLPERLIRERGVLPLAERDGALVVALKDARDERAMRFATDLAGQLELSVVTLSAVEFDAFMDERYPLAIAQVGAELVSRVPPAPAPQAPPPPSAEPPAAPKLAPTPAARPDVPPAPVRALAADAWASPDGARFFLSHPLKRQVAELDAKGHASWHYRPEGEALARQKGPFAHAARVAGERVLVVDAGASRILEVDAAGKTVWSSADEARLKAPRHALRLASGHTLVADTGNNRVVDLGPDGKLHWSYGELGCSGNGLFKPSALAVLANGHLLIADTGNHRVIELDTQRRVVWQVGNAPNRLGAGAGRGENELNEPTGLERLPNGHTLVADSGNHRVIELDSHGRVVWHFALHEAGEQAPADVFLAKRVAEGRTLVAGRQAVCLVDASGTVLWTYHLVPPASVGGLRSAAPSLRRAAPVVQALKVRAEVDAPLDAPQRFVQADRAGHRVYEVDRAGDRVWQYTGLGRAGSEEGSLDRPHYVRRLRSGHTLIADTGHHRVLEIDASGALVWQFGVRGKLGAGPRQLANPRSAERLTNGHTLIADQSNKRLIEVDAAGTVAWQLDHAGGQRLQAPAYATRLENGNVLVVDWGAHVVYELTPAGGVVWQFGQFGRSGAEPHLLAHPEHASRAPNGHTLICDTQNHRVLEIDGQGRLAWQYGGAGHWPRVGRFGLQYLTPVAAWALPDGTVLVQHAGKGHIVLVDRDLAVRFQHAP